MKQRRGLERRLAGAEHDDALVHQALEPVVTVAAMIVAVAEDSRGQPRNGAGTCAKPFSPLATTTRRARSVSPELSVSWKPSSVGWTSSTTVRRTPGTSRSWNQRP